MINRDKLFGGIVGLCVGDALGVPVEFQHRDELKRNPVTDMREYGVHFQPKGTWSDDSSLTFCSVESLIGGYNIYDMAGKFVDWMTKKYWTPHGVVFDIGFGTKTAIKVLSSRNDIEPYEAGSNDFQNNGNGSLMRILPLAFYLYKNRELDRKKIIREVSGLTHGHLISIISCQMYIELVLNLLDGDNKIDAYNKARETIKKEFNQVTLEKYFFRVVEDNVVEKDEDRITGGGYVINSLEASIWCFINSNSYEEAVLKAVNLGDDTDTTGAITGGLAGIYYGYEKIPEKWVEVIARREDILDLCERFYESLEMKNKGGDD